MADNSLKHQREFQDQFKKKVHKVMYAESESAAREAFDDLSKTMISDAEKAIKCLEKDLDSLLAHYKFERRFWRTLRTTNPIERINKELKRRTKSMETLGGRTLNMILAFVAMRLEFYWQRSSVDKYPSNDLFFTGRNQIETAFET